MNVDEVHRECYVGRHQLLVTVICSKTFVLVHYRNVFYTILLVTIFGTSVFHLLPVHSNMHRHHNSGFLMFSLYLLPQQGSVFQC